MVRISFGVINQAVRIIFWLKHKYSLIKNGPGAVADLYRDQHFGEVDKLVRGAALPSSHLASSLKCTFCPKLCKFECQRATTVRCSGMKVNLTASAFLNIASLYNSTYSKTMFIT